MRLGFMIAASMMLTASSASAEWLSDVKEDPFDGDVHLALTASGPYGFGFRCRNADDLTLILITPEQANATEAATLTRLGVKMLAIVDAAPKITLAAKAQAVESGLAFFAEDEAVLDIFRSLRNAKKRIAVAIEMAGSNYHSTSFRASGAKRALSKLSKSCGIAEPSAPKP